MTSALQNTLVALDLLRQVIIIAQNKGTLFAAQFAFTNGTSINADYEPIKGEYSLRIQR
jgi:hypothetical protein